MGESGTREATVHHAVFLRCPESVVGSIGEPEKRPRVPGIRRSPVRPPVGHEFRRNFGSIESGSAVSKSSIRMKLEPEAYRQLCNEVLERDGWHRKFCGRGGRSSSPLHSAAESPRRLDEQLASPSFEITQQTRRRRVAKLNFVVYHVPRETAP